MQEESKEVQEFKAKAKLSNVNGVSIWQRLGIPKELQRKIDIENSRKPKNRRHRKRKRQRQQLEFETVSKRAKEYLVTFWNLFNSTDTNEKRLALLKTAANPGWSRVSGKMRSRCRRDKNHKMSILFGALGVVKCAGCTNPAMEKHHIIPCCYGGPTIVENLVLICMDCHKAIHPRMD